LNAEPEAQCRVIKTIHEQWRCKYTQHENKENTSRLNYHYREEVRKGRKHHLTCQQQKIRLQTISISHYQKLLSQEIKKFIGVI
jgi:hypothetical protein